MKRRRWLPHEDMTLRRLYPDTVASEIADLLERQEYSVYNRAQQLGLKKSAAFMESEQAKRLDGRIGEKFRFTPGHEPWNKGLKGFQAGGRAKETQFKKGHRPANWVPVGTEVTDRDGYLKRKIRDDAPAGQSRFNWKYVHILTWEKHNGPVPPGHVVIFKDGVKHRTEIENLELITQAENARRNSIHRYPPEVKAVIRLNGRLRREVRKREKQNG